MANATYIHGTTEYLMVEVAVIGPGATFDPAEWTAEICLVPRGTVFDASTAPWAAAALETIADKFYVKALLGSDIDADPGQYRAYVRFTSLGESAEAPVLRASGVVVVA